MPQRATAFSAALAAVLICAAAGTALGQTKLETVDPHDPRRTPVVEVFHHWRDSVVYLTGPLASAPGPTIDEFFQVPLRRETISIGSGFVVHESGYVITNAHAVERVITHHATLTDGRTYPAELIGLSREYDLALLKVEAGRPLQPVQLGKSNDFLLGETVIIISNPAGLLHTCTTGVISASERHTLASGLPGVVLRDLIQTDASINPGSSGGPWFNVLGEVVGVTTAKQVGSQNIGFGIPVMAVRHTLPQMLDVERRYGIFTGLTTQDQPQEPCVVSEVAAGSPAALAGIRSGDVVKKLGGLAIIGRCEFLLSLIGCKPGQNLELDLERSGRTVRDFAHLGRPAETRRGLATAATLRTDGRAAQRGQPQETSLRVHRGVVITAVVSGAPYNKLQTPPLPGDVLARINSIRPRDLDQVGLLLDAVKPGEPVHFVLLRMKDRVATRIDIMLTLTK